MAEGGDRGHSGDSDLKSISTLSVRGGDDDEETIKDSSSYMSFRGNFGEDQTESVVCSISTLSVTAGDEVTTDSGSSFLSLQEAQSDISESTVRSRSQERKPAVKQLDFEFILHSRSSDNELLCEYCHQGEVRTKATHFCELCGTNGKKMCYKCLRYHTKFLSHREVTSLLTSTEGSDSTKDRENAEKPKSRPCQLFYCNILTDKDRKLCTAIDFAQMSNGNLMIADYANKCVKIFYFDTLLLKEVFYVEHHPMCITCFPDNIVAVAYKDALCLEIFERRHETLRIYKELGDCNGLKCQGEYLYILGSCTVCKYYLQDRGNLKLVRRIDLKPIGIYEPEQIDIDEFGDTLYISDAVFGVYILNKSGRLLNRIPVNEARGISSDGLNKVFVCCFDTDEVLKINQETAKTNLFLSLKHGVNAPCALFFDRIRRRLYVGMHNNNYILYVDILD
ncbi:uncharacterized protein LOC132737839 isoform X2 [Ruditapes philippinarum]|uniref:uncharacterized protein LOC132737839 isoform X2 n=1 Tax=Ruditapes philippinarum TaxID=129788 RepID=UPI00295A96BF|nr:uncharacterized protein LOC132737839 isoform X2 [Ruditapes philippinarum]